MYIKSFLYKCWKRYLRAKDKKNIINHNHNVSNYQYEKVFDFRKKGFSLYESTLYNLTADNYQNYINTWEAYQPRYNLSKYHMISDDKYLFSLVFSHYVEVPTTYGLINNGVVEAVDNDLASCDLYDFLIKKQGGVIKDRIGYNGFNIKVFKVENNIIISNGRPIKKNELDEIVTNYKNGLIQSLVTQGDFENSLFDKTINTIRMITMRKPNETEHEVVCATQRIGSNVSLPTDNFSQGGYSAIIDLETGELSSITNFLSKDNLLKQQFFDYHPDTGNQIKGKIIPNWSTIKEHIISLTKKLPFFDYIAWDIALKNDRIVVIEINMKSSLGNIQVHGGIRHSKLGEAYKNHGYLVDEKNFAK